MSVRSYITARHRLLAHGIAALSATLLVATGAALNVAEPDGSLAIEYMQSGVPAFVLGFGGVGWLLARRVPRNLIGWCFAFGGLMWARGGLDDAWVQLALTGHVELGAVARALATLGFFGWIFSMPFSVQLPLLLLPDGRLLSAAGGWRSGRCSAES